MVQWSQATPTGCASNPLARRTAISTDTLYTKAAARRVGITTDSLRDAADRGRIPHQWADMPDGQRWRAFKVADLDQYKSRRLAVLESQLAAVKGGAA